MFLSMYLNTFVSLFCSIQSIHRIVERKKFCSDRNLNRKTGCRISQDFLIQQKWEEGKRSLLEDPGKLHRNQGTKISGTRSCNKVIWYSLLSHFCFSLRSYSLPILNSLCSFLHKKLPHKTPVCWSSPYWLDFAQSQTMRLISFASKVTCVRHDSEQVPFYPTSFSQSLTITKTFCTAYQGICTSYSDLLPDCHFLCFLF